MNELTTVGIPSGPLPFTFDPATIERFEQQLAGKRSHNPDLPSASPDLVQTRNGNGAVDIVLYVSGSSMNCGRATIALEAVLREFPASAVHFRVVDILHDMDGAARDRVLFTPTLIFTDQEQRKTRVLGDLSNQKLLWDLLLAAGLEPI
jgi:hypothetical protein